MNKKLVFGAVLLGAMTLTSCVDDTESASVTAIRQAKAEQLPVSRRSQQGECRRSAHSGKRLQGSTGGYRSLQ